MTDQPDTLLEAVHSLTDRYSIHATRDDGTKVRLRQKPRLEALREAIHPSGNSAGGGALARERNLIDTGALDLHRAIKRDIDNAARLVDAIVNPVDPAITLKRWLIKARQKHPTDAFETEWAAKWAKRAHDIDVKLNPPTITEIMRPCPFCGESKAVDPASSALVTAVIVEHWKSGQDGVGSSRIRCRFCGESGISLAEVRRWAYDIEAQELEAGVA